MTELAGLRPSDREDIIGSTKNRILNLLQNPVVELSLGKPNGHVDLRRAIQDRAIIIVNLARGGVLRDEDVEIFANLWLMEVLFAIYNTPRSQRVPHVIAIDELPVFRSSFELITNALPQVRKYLCRFAVAFQGAQLFEGRQEDRLLNALVSQCNAHFIFRHKNPVDAKFFGEVLKLPSFDTHKVKHVLTQLQQYQDGNEIVVLRDTSTSDSHAAQDGGSSSDAVSETTSTSQGTSSGASESTGRGVNQVEGAVHRALSTNDGRAEQWGSNESRSASNGSTSKESFSPRPGTPGRGAGGEGIQASFEDPSPQPSPRSTGARESFKLGFVRARSCRQCSSFRRMSKSWRPPATSRDSESGSASCTSVVLVSRRFAFHFRRTRWPVSRVMPPRSSPHCGQSWSAPARRSPPSQRQVVFPN